MKLKQLALILIFGFYSAFTLAEQAKAKRYTIEGEAKIGSRFKYIEATSDVPFKKTYEQFSNDQKRLFRQRYKLLSERTLAKTETPPFPEGGLFSIYDPLIKKNKLVAVSGIVFFIALVDEEGIAQEVTVYQSPNNEMTDFVNTVAFATKFTPGTCDGVPCAMEFPFETKLRPYVKNNDIDGIRGDSTGWTNAGK